MTAAVVSCFSASGRCFCAAMMSSCLPVRFAQGGFAIRVTLPSRRTPRRTLPMREVARSPAESGRSELKVEAPRVSVSARGSRSDLSWPRGYEPPANGQLSSEMRLALLAACRQRTPALGRQAPPLQLRRRTSDSGGAPGRRPEDDHLGAYLHQRVEGDDVGFVHARAAVRRPVAHAGGGERRLHSRSTPPSPDAGRRRSCACARACVAVPL